MSALFKCVALEGEKAFALRAVPEALSSVERISAVHCPGQEQSVSSTGLRLAGWTPFPAGSETKVAVLTHSAALTIFSNPQIA